MNNKKRAYYTINEKNELVRHDNVVDYQRARISGHISICQYARVSEKTAIKIKNHGTYYAHSHSMFVK